MYSTISMITCLLSFAGRFPQPVLSLEQVGWGLAGPAVGTTCSWAVPLPPWRPLRPPPCAAPLPRSSGLRLGPQEPKSQRSVSGAGGGSVALPAASLALVTFGQPLCLLSLLWQILIKNAEQGLIFFSVNFEFGKREHLSASGPIQMKGKEVHQGDCSSQN